MNFDTPSSLLRIWAVCGTHVSKALAACGFGNPPSHCTGLQIRRSDQRVRGAAFLPRNPITMKIFANHRVFSPHGKVTGSWAFDYKQIFGSCQIHKIRNSSVKSPMTDRRGKTYPHRPFPFPLTIHLIIISRGNAFLPSGISSWSQVLSSRLRPSRSR